ncbi:MAG TPA: hypothetical protein VF316_06850 [Polyangiaceae bacterium]
MRPGAAFVVSCALVGSAGAARAEDTVPIGPDNGKPMVHYRDEAPRPGYHLVRSQMTGFFAASSFVLILSYSFSFAFAVDAKFENGSAWMAVPLVGPFVGVTKLYCGGFTRQPPYSDCGSASMMTAEALIALGVVQNVGAVLFPFGFLHRRYWQRDGLVPTVAFQDGLRVGVVGTF